MAVTGKKVGLSDEKIASALTPLLAVKARRVIGGPSPEVVERAVQERFEYIEKKEKNLNGREERLKHARKTLLKEVDLVLGG